MPVFRWFAAGPVPPAWDLRLCGWQRTCDEHAVLLVPQALAIARQRRLCAIPIRLRQRIVVLGVGSSALRGKMLEAGVGDALPPSANLIELSARAWRVIAMLDAQPRQRRIGPAVLDLVARDVRAGNRNAGLHPREFGLLWRLAEEPGRIVSMAVLWNELWRRAFQPDTNSLHVHVCRLRAKLRRIGVTDLIETVPGIGYRLAVDADPPFAPGAYLQWSGSRESEPERIHEA